MNNFLCECINKLSEIELRYSGYTRIVHPYTCGYNKDGEILVRCFQVAGGSASGERSGWKLLKVNEISSMAKTGNSFEVKSDYARGDKGIFKICCQI